MLYGNTQGLLLSTPIHSRVERYTVLYGSTRLEAGKIASGRCPQRRNRHDNQHGADPWLGKAPPRQLDDLALYGCQTASNRAHFSGGVLFGADHPANGVPFARRCKLRPRCFMLRARLESHA
jgi:hypothetical protein